MNQVDPTVLGTAQAAIRIERVSKRYGETIAVDKLNLTVRQGQTFGLLGPNGAGKTTTIRMLAGLAEPDAGNIEILQQSTVHRTVSLKRRIGFVPEKHHIYPWMRVRELIRFAAALYPSWDDKLCDELLQLFELPSNKKIRHLSKGMTAKLGLLVALSPRPEVLLLDEPTSGLDPLIRDEFLEGILATQSRQKGRAMLFSSHQIEDVARIADVVGIMDKGRLVLIEDVATIHDRVKLMRAVIGDGRLPCWTPTEALWTRLDRREWTLTLYPFERALAEKIAEKNPIVSFDVVDVSLEDVFKQVIRGRRASAIQEH